MHHEIRHHLEDFLNSEALLEGEDFLGDSRLPAEFHAHLGECAECSQELRSLQAQSQLLRCLRSPQDLEPRAGFYARVMQRIEAQPASIWSVFLDRRFGLRLAVASAALVALLGTYLVTSEPSGPEVAAAPAIVLTDTLRATAANLGTETGTQEQQRDAVLVDLAS